MPLPFFQNAHILLREVSVFKICGQISSELGLMSRTGDCGWCLNHLLDSEASSSSGDGAWADLEIWVLPCGGHVRHCVEEQSLLFHPLCISHFGFKCIKALGIQMKPEI